jgi:peptidoglycan/LPS O-acetylase OafA/YrhL
MIWPDSLGFNKVYWTLLFEVQFYLAYPLLLWVVRRGGLYPTLAALAAVEVAYLYLDLAPKYLFVYRYFEWCLGVLAAEWSFRPPGPAARRAVYLVAPLAAAAAGSVFVPAVFPLRDVFSVLAFFGLVVRLGSGPGPGERGLRSAIGRFFAAVGAFSYSLYLVHIPVLDLVWTAQRLAVKYHVIPYRGGELLGLGGVPACLLVAYLFYRLFERPFLKRSG